MQDWAEYLKMLAGLFVIIDPIGLIPLYLGVTPLSNASARRAVALRSTATAFLALTVAALVGESVLGLFGITMGSFQVIGGIVLLLIALDMVNARLSRTKETPEEAVETSSRYDPAIVPLGIPMIAGPGALSTVILYSDKARAPIDYGLLLSLVVIVCLACYLCMRLAVPLGRRLGTTGINVMTRLMGLVAGAIGVEFIAEGLRGLFPSLG